MHPKYRVPSAIIFLLAVSLLLTAYSFHLGHKLQEQSKEFAELSTKVTELENRPTALTKVVYIEVEPKPEETMYLDIPLETKYQDLVKELCIDTNVDPETVFAIMWKESRFQEDVVGYNTNGTYDSGLCQINSTNTSWLMESGFDITTTEGNIAAAIFILDGHLENYSLKEALAAYNAGPAGMLNGNGFTYAQSVLDKREEFINV